MSVRGPLAPAVTSLIGNYRWFVLGLFAFIDLVGSVDTQISAPLSPFLLVDLHTTEARIGLLSSAVFAGTALASVPAGWLTDLIGVRLILWGAQVLMGLLLLVFAGASDLWQGVLLTALIGVGFSTISPSASKVITQWFPVHERATAMAIRGIGYTAGGIVAGATLPVLALTIGWQQGIRLFGIGTIFFSFATLAWYREPGRSPRGTTDVSPRAKRDFAAVLGNRNFRILLASWFLHSVVKAASMAYVVLFLNQRLLLSPATAGLGMALGQAAASAGRLVYGRISDTLFGGRRRPMLFLGMALGAASCWIVSLLPPGTPAFPALLAASFLGLGTLATVPIFMVAAAEFAGTDRAGTAAGIGLTNSSVGLTIGPAVFGWLLALSGSYVVAWQAMAALMALGLLVLTAYREPRQ